MKKINNVHSFYKSIKVFENYFKPFMDKPYNYIFIIDDSIIKDKHEEKINTLINFCQKYSIRQIAIGSQSIQVFNDFDFNIAGIEADIEQLSSYEFLAVKNLYELFPICGNLKFIGMNIHGRVFPKNATDYDLFKIIFQTEEQQ